MKTIISITNKVSNENKVMCILVCGVLFLGVKIISDMLINGCNLN